MTNQPVLRRDASHRVLGGVCAGLARTWRVDPLLVRAAAVVAAAVTSGAALLAYLILWVLLPTDRPGGRGGVRTLRPSHALLVLALVAATLAFVVPESRFSAIGFALLGFASLAWYASARAVQRRAPAVAAPGPDQQWRQPPRPGATASIGVPGGRPVARPWPKILGLTLLAWAAIAGLDAAGVRVGGVAYPASALAILGFALLRGSRAGVSRRPRGALPLGVAAAIATVTMLGATPSTNADVVTFHDPTALPESVELGTGTHTVDLSSLALDRDRTIRITQDAGELTLILPSANAVAAQYVVDMGQVASPQQRAGGMDLSVTESYLASGRPLLTVDVDLSMGRLEVRR